MAVTRRDILADIGTGVDGRRMTLEQFLTLPEEEPSLEYHEGMVTRKVAPQAQHVLLQLDFTNRVNAAARPQKLALALPELRTTYGGVSRVPDVAIYLWERVPRLENGRIANRFVEPPDIAVEVVSSDQRVTEVVSTCVWYVKNGVRIALLIDPDEDVVPRFQADALPDVLQGDDRIDLDAVLPGFELTVNELFAALTLD